MCRLVGASPRRGSLWLTLAAVAAHTCVTASPIVLEYTALLFPGEERYLVIEPENTFLAILPLGGSITLGFGSSTGNGYRKPLRDQLRQDGWSVHMVGTKTGATNAPVTGSAMADDNVEAVAGYVLSQIADLLDDALPATQPNLVLINAGVNDCAKGVDIPGIGDRMNGMLDAIFRGVPGTTVVVSTLLPCLDAGVAGCHDDVNAQYRRLVGERSARGDKILLAELAPSEKYWDEVLGGDYYDSTHPTDSGHAKMASIWYRAIKAADALGWITAPAAYDYASASGDDANTFKTKVLPAAP